MIELGSKYCVCHDDLLFVFLHIRGFRVQGGEVLMVVVRVFMERVCM